jgi:hypothetical protein
MCSQTNPFAKNSQPSSAFDNRNILEKLRETIDDDKFKEVFNDLVFVSVLHHYQRISRLLNPQVETSQHDISSIMQILPFGIKAYSVYEYSWRDLKEYLQTPNLAVLVRLPSHCALVFAAGENLQTGKERHVLVGRPSGGQSPCGWIPFMFSNKSPEEVLWRDEITLSGSIQSSTKYGLTMYLSEPLTKNNTNYFIGQRELIIIRADPAASRKEIHFSDYDLAVLDALFYSGPVYACDRCFAHNSICSSFVQ